MSTGATTRTTVAAAIIAGGRGTRMHRSGVGVSVNIGETAGAREPVTKGLLVVDGRRIIDRQLEALRACFDQLLIVANDPSPWQGLGVRVVADREQTAGGDAGAGPLAGLDAALGALPPDGDAVVCVASDMPFLEPALLRLLRDGAPEATALVPRIDGRPEPLLARYARACAPVVHEQLARGDYAVMHLLARLPVTWIDEPALRAVDPQLRSVINVNTPDDLAAAGRRPFASPGG